MPTWRWLDTGAANGFINMAIDEAILVSYQRRNVAPTVRVYRWRPACVSLGYFQPARDVNTAACRDRNVDIVRRLSGGRAILHDHELTYSVVVDEDTLDARGVMPTFRKISGAIIVALKEIGIPAELKASAERSEAAPRSGAACFATAARCDLVVSGKKIVGSAQVRRAGAFLQHGAIPLCFDPCAAQDLLPGGDGLKQKVVDVRTASGNDTLSYAELAAALRRGFESALGLDLERGRLTDEEQERAQGLAQTKYATPQWTHRR